MILGEEGKINMFFFKIRVKYNLLKLKYVRLVNFGFFNRKDGLIYTHKFLHKI